MVLVDFSLNRGDCLGLVASIRQQIEIIYYFDPPAGEAGQLKGHCKSVVFETKIL